VLDIVSVPFKDELNANDNFPQLKFGSTVHGVSRLFAKTKFAKTRLKLELFMLWSFAALGSKQTLSENIDFKKLNQKHAKIQVIEKIFDKKFSSL